MLPPLHAPSELRDRLQATLGASLVIERELAGAGMSRVFVAHDEALGRRVVVKVLPPEAAAALSAERFKREILLAVALQHPHVVPVLAAGEIDGLPYYMMPLIEGESLRTRLTSGPVPLAEGIGILCEVADALAHAHARGVVHRDVKPDNILLSHGHAVVTDFGVAKAISAAGARRRADGHDTGVGVAVGTPAYMAPEQAAGDPDTDHRADLYAFGLLAYELLGGRTPFGARSPHELLAAHLTERPTPIAELRPDVPTPLARLVMRCLEKRPEDRPASADEIRRTLDAIATPDAALAVRRPRRGWFMVAGVAATILFLAAATLLWRERAGRRPLDEHAVAVLPFRLTSGDPSLRYLREGMLDLLAATLTGEGGPRAVDPRTLLGAWHRAAGGDTTDLPRGRALALGESLGAAQLLVGEIGGDARRLVISASLVRVIDGRAQTPVTVAGSPDSLPQLVDRLTAQLLAVGAGQRERLTALTSTSLPALRAYLDAQWRFRRAHFREATAGFERAVRLDSTFALAALGMAMSASWFGDPKLRFEGLQIAFANRDRLSARDLALFESEVGPRYPAQPTAIELVRAKERYRALAPDRADAWMQLGEGYFHWGRTAGIIDAETRAADAFHRVIAMDSSFSPAIEHLLFLEARLGDTASVRRLAALYLAVDSTTENADGVRWRAAAALGDTAALAALDRRRDALNPISAHSISMIAQLDGVDLPFARRVLREVLERRDLSASDRYAFTFGAHDLALNAGQPDEALAITGRYRPDPPIRGVEERERIRDAIYWDGDTSAAARAARELEVAMEGPLPSAGNQRGIWMSDLCHVELWRLARGDTSSVRRTLARLAEGTAGPDGAPFAPAGNVCALVLEGTMATMSRDAQVTAPVVTRLDSLTRAGIGGVWQHIAALTTARLLEHRGDIVGALATVRRRDYFLGRPLFLSTFLREEARLATLAGDREGAAEAWQHYLALREGAAPALQSDVESARAALRRLETEGAIP